MKKYILKLKEKYLHGITTDENPKPVFTESQTWAYKFKTNKEAKEVKNKHKELKSFKIIEQ